MKTCPFCGKETREYETVDLFQYGADEDGVILEAAVIVQTCDDCSTGWTDYRAEDARQSAIEKYLASKGIYLCGVCKEVPVDVDNGYDTCDNCVGRI